MHFESLEPRRLLSVVPTVVDLLAVYTPAAKNLHGGDAGIQSLIRGAVGFTNQHMMNSAIPVAIRLVHLEQIDYSGSNDLFVDRERMQNSSDGFMDNLPSLRNQYGADLVTLISDGPNIGGGIAYLLENLAAPDNDTKAFSVIAENSIGPVNGTLAHELGHNLGAGHERNNPTQPAVGPFSYSYGYRFTAQGVVYHEQMSYDPGLVVPYYANPAVSFRGAPTGSPIGAADEADLASTFAVTAPIVAAYRSTVVADNSGPTASVYELNRSGSSLNITIRYTDESGVDISSLESGDITVNGPGNFALPATLVSIDKPTVGGAIKLATYHVTLPATTPPTTALSINLRPGAVRDVSGHFASAGALPKAVVSDAGPGFALARELGTIALGSTRTMSGLLSNDDTDQLYRFTLASPATISVRMTGMTDDANVYVARDDDGDGVYDFNEKIFEAFEPGSNNEGIARTLAAGTYFAWVYRLAPTPYTLSIQAYTDTTPPTATLDATDMKTAGAPYLEFAVTYKDDFDINGEAARFSSAVDLHFMLDGGADFTFPVYPQFTLNNSSANAPSKTIYFRVLAFSQQNGWTAADNGTIHVSIHQNTLPERRVHDGADNDIPLLALGSFKIAIGTPDSAAPTATLDASPPVAGQTTWSFNVAYHDNVTLNTTTLDGSDIRVTGPGAFDQLAVFDSVTPAPTIGSTRIATYHVTAPGGFWDGTDDGQYTIALLANQVRDPSNNAAAAGTLGTLNSSMPHLVAQAPGVVAFNGTASADALRFDTDANFVYFNLNDTTLWYIPVGLVSSTIVNGLGGADSIVLQSGSLVIANDLAGLSVNVSTGAALTFNSTQHLDSLHVNGSATLGSAGNRVLVTSALALGAAGALDIKDNALIVDYAGPTPAADIRSLLISTSIGSSAVLNSTRTVGYAEASQLFSTFPAAFFGQSIDTTAVLVRFTVNGDVNLDGAVNITDLGILATNWQQSPRVFAQGDLNYDGVVDITDLGTLATNWQTGLPLASRPATIRRAKPDTTLAVRAVVLS